MSRDMEKKVRFRDLSGPMKTAIIFVWCNLIYTAGLFIVGLILGMLGLI